MQYVMFHVNSSGSGADTIYYCDDNGNAAGAAIYKYCWSGSTWVAKGSATLATAAGLTAIQSGTTVTLFATSGSAANNSLYSLTDSSGFNGTLSGTPTAIASAGSNKTWRGVALAPVSPPTVTASAATAIGTTAATLNGNVTSDGGATVTDRGFVYKTSGGVTISDNKTMVSGTTGAFTLTPTLSANGHYYFKAYAINSVGTTLSSELNFWTLANTPAAPTVNTPSSSSLDVVIGSGDGNPSTTAYAIHETSQNEYVQADGTLGASAIFQTASAWGTKTVTGLNASSTYTFEVAAQNGGGTPTSFGSPTSGTTSAAATPPFNLASSANPAGYQDSVSFTANTILPANVTGTIQFTTNGVNLGGAVTISSGSAGSIAAMGLPRGSTNVIQAIYSGDANYAAITQTLTQTVTNHPPVAVNSNFTRNAGIASLRIVITNLLAAATDADGDTVTFVGTAVSTNGISVSSLSGNLSYYNTNAVDDRFTYTVTDGFGGTNTATIIITVNTNAIFGMAQAPSLAGGGHTATLNFAGIPYYGYTVQRSINLTDWSDLWTTNAPGNGAFQFIDSFGDNPPAQAYYRLRYNP